LEPAHLSHCLLSRRRSPLRSHSGRTALATGTGQNAPHLSFATPVGICPVGWESVIRFGIRSGRKSCSRRLSSINILSRRSPRGTGHIDHAICACRRGNRHQNSHGQSRSVRTLDGTSQGDQCRSVGSLDGKSRRGNRSSSIRQIRRQLRQAIPSPMGYPNPSPMNNPGHIPGNTLENN